MERKLEKTQAILKNFQICVGFSRGKKCKKLFSKHICWTKFEIDFSTQKNGQPTYPY